MRTLAALLLVGATAQAGPVPPAPECVSNAEKALEIARTRGKLILVTIIVDNDAESRMVIDEIFRNREFLKIAPEFVCVYANPHDEHGKVQVKGPDGKPVLRCADCPSITCEDHKDLALNWARGFFRDEVKTPIHLIIDHKEKVVARIFEGSWETGFNPVPASKLVAQLKKLLAKHGRGLSEKQYKKMLDDLASARAARARDNLPLELKHLLAVTALEKDVDGVRQAKKRVEEIDALAAKELEEVGKLVEAKEWEAALDALDKLCEAYPGTPTSAKAEERKEELLREKEVKRLLRAADLYERGLKYKERKRLDLARKKFEEIVRRYSDTKYCPLAEKELQALGDG